MPARASLAPLALLVVISFVRLDDSLSHVVVGIHCRLDAFAREGGDGVRLVAFNHLLDGGTLVCVPVGSDDRIDKAHVRDRTNSLFGSVLGMLKLNAQTSLTEGHAVTKLSKALLDLLDQRWKLEHLPQSVIPVGKRGIEKAAGADAREQMLANFAKVTVRESIP